MRGFIFEALTSTREKFLGPFYRRLGKKIYVLGNKIHGEQASEDRLVPSLRKITYSGFQPYLQAADFIAPNSTILGNVTLGFNSSVWYGSTIIGTSPITIGDNTVIQDRVHISKQVKIGNDAFVGPNCILQGSTIEDGAFIAMGSSVRHATIESGSLVAAGAVINDNIIVKEGEIWAGNPGKFLRNLTAIQRQILKQHLEEMRDLAVIHSDQTQKNSRQVISGAFAPYQSNDFENYLTNVDSKFQYDEIDDEFIERRTFMRERIKAVGNQTDYEAFEQNISHLSEKFNVGIHDEQFKKISTKIKEKEHFDNDTNPWKQPF